MSILQFLQLQPVEPSDDDTISPLDDYMHDEIIDLNSEIDESVLTEEWDMVMNDLKTDSEKLTFAEE